MLRRSRSCPLNLRNVLQLRSILSNCESSPNTATEPRETSRAGPNLTPPMTRCFLSLLMGWSRSKVAARLLLWFASKARRTSPCSFRLTAPNQISRTGRIRTLWMSSRPPSSENWGLLRPDCVMTPPLFGERFWMRSELCHRLNSHELSSLIRIPPNDRS